MRTFTKTGLLATGLAAMLAGGVAVAQSAAPPPPPGADAPPPGGPRGPMADRGGPEGWGHGHGRGHHMRPPPPTKAAFFHFRKGDARVTIKCADDEPMKACVEAGSALLDKLAAQPK